MTILPKQSDIDLLAQLIDIRDSADLAGHTDDLFRQWDPQGAEATVFGPGGNSQVVSKLTMRRLRDLDLFYVIDSGPNVFRFDLADDVRDRLEQMRVAVGETPPLPGTPASEPDPALIATRHGVDAKRSESQGAARGPGRPGWTAELFWTRYQEARGRAKPPYTYRAISPHFETLDGTRGTDPEYVRKLVRRYRRPPE